jgi:TolB-like protein/DNA-binding winged helix-turn-helix (wHTH) protein
MDGTIRLRLGAWTLDPDRRSLVGPAGEEKRLRRQSFAVLRYLADHAGRVVGKDELTAAVWPGIAVTDDSLVQCVSEMRQAIGPRGREVLRTVPRQGYILDFPADEAPAARSRPWRIGWALGGLLGVALLAAALLGMSRTQPPAAGPPLLAVLTFASMSGDPALDYFARGAAETLVAGLSRSPFLRVIQVEPEAPGPAVAAQAARNVGARFALTGSVQKGPEQMRIVAQLLDARTTAPVWARRIDRSDPDPFAVQDAVVEEIVRTLAGEQGVVQRAQYANAWGKDSSSLGEYDYYLRAHDLHMKFEPGALDRAQATYEDGLVEYPDSALLKIKLGYAHFTRAWMVWTPDVQGELAQARGYAERGLAEADQSPLSLQTGHMLLADLAAMEGDFETAMWERARVLELAPNDFFARANLSTIPVAAGRPEETIASLRDISPHHPGAEIGYGSLAWAHFALGDYRASIEAAAAPFNPQPQIAFAVRGRESC